MFEAKIKELGLKIPEAPKPLAAYIPAILIGGYVYTSGQVPIEKGEIKYAGAVGRDITEEEGKKAAEMCALNCLGAIKSVIKDLDKIEQVVKLTVFVHSATGFTNQPQVANGASELIGQIFGDKGAHARSAVGVNSLPRNAAVEVEMIVKVRE